MSKKVLLGLTVFLGFSLVCFGFFQMDFRGEQEEENIAVAKAEALTAQFINQVYRAHFTGDLSELKQFLAEKDTEGVIQGVLEEQGIDLEAPRLRILSSIYLPPFDNSNNDSNFEDGSVLLSGTKESLIHLVIPGIYTHAGLLDQDLYTGPNAGCVITANLEGVTYETWNDWASYDGAGKIVTKLNVEEAPGVWPKARRLTRAQRWIRRYMGWTIYSFLKLNLDPVSRWDPFRWYCSKTVWRVLHRRGLNLDVENEDWYGSTLQKSLYKVRDSFLYQLIAKWLGPEKAEEKLWAALEECIAPDEIRFATTPPPSGTAGGPLDPESKETWGMAEPF